MSDKLYIQLTNPFSYIHKNRDIDKFLSKLSEQKDKIKDNKPLLNWLDIYLIR